MNVSPTSDQTKNTFQIQQEVAMQPKAAVIKPNNGYSSFLNNYKVLLISGAVTAISVGLFILINNYTQAFYAAKQAAEAAKRAANLQKPCLVANQKQLFLGTGEQIAQCGLQMVANDGDIEIQCDPQVVKEITETYGLKHNVNCDGTVKYNFNESVIIGHRPSGDRVGGSEAEIAAEKVPVYLKWALSYGNNDFILTPNQARVKMWGHNFNTVLKALEKAKRSGKSS